MKLSDSVWIAFAEIRKAPNSYLYAVLIVAISIAAVIAGLSAARGLVRPLPVPDGDEVYRVRAVSAEGGETNLSSEDYALWRLNLESAPELGAFSNAFSLVDLHGEVFEARISFVTENASEILQVEPIIGRWPGADEAGSVVIGFHLWDSIYGRSPDVLNEPVRFQDETWTITGVMPDGFRFPFMEDMWKVVAPLSESLLSPEVFLRLGDEADSSEVSREMQSILDTADGAERTRLVQLLGFTDERGGVGEAQLLGAVLLVSLAMALVACSNVCNLLAERAMGRTPELAVHQAVGATESNIVAQLLTESALVGIVGAVAGVG
ncbi:MAG: ABC transporter permease, partial [Gammaproteobacteria bacterium]|nr:ABC transporter permease [Gammaproteobacteria bacterium]